MWVQKEMQDEINATVINEKHESVFSIFVQRFTWHNIAFPKFSLIILTKALFM